MMKNINTKTLDVIMRVLAVMLPFYMVYYHTLHEQPAKSEHKTLWRFTFLGFAVYMIGAVLLVF